MNPAKKGKKTGGQKNKGIIVFSCPGPSERNPRKLFFFCGDFGMCFKGGMAEYADTFLFLIPLRRHPFIPGG